MTADREPSLLASDPVFEDIDALAARCDAEAKAFEMRIPGRESLRGRFQRVDVSLRQFQSWHRATNSGLPAGYHAVGNPGQKQDSRCEATSQEINRLGKRIHQQETSEKPTIRTLTPSILVRIQVPQPS